jgi:hypothetical protein
MARLTLNLDKELVTRARRFAARQGISLSRLVERLLDRLVKEADPEEDPPPVLARLRAEFKGAQANPSTYRRYLERKYRSR